LRSEEGRGGQQMSPKLLNQAVLTKSTQLLPLKYNKNPNGTFFSTYKPGM
jgi:hypothetical protein